MSGPNYSLYQRLPAFVLGFHGCEKAVGEKVLSTPNAHLKPSTNLYDWLGDGIYFWENDPLRALEFAQERSRKPAGARGHITEPFVVGAVIDLGYCLNLLDRTALSELPSAHTTLQAIHNNSGEPMPTNKGLDLGARFLDRAVIQTLHESREYLNTVGDFPPYDSVRSAFFEGQLFSGTGFAEKNHIQIAVRNTACIRGYFRPIEG